MESMSHTFGNFSLGECEEVLRLRIPDMISETDRLQRTLNRDNAWPEWEISDDAKNGIKELERLAESQREEGMDSDYLQAVQNTITVRNQTRSSSIICSRFPTNVLYLWSAGIACHSHRKLTQTRWEEEVRVRSTLPRVRAHDI